MTSVFSDEFYQTQKGEAFEKSQCMIHEHRTAGLFYSMLTALGYQCTDPNRRVWKSPEKTVIMCLSDDFTFSKTTKFPTVEKFFESSTVAITDNYIQFHPQYTVLRLPDSYFGIFHYVPDLMEFEPTKRFNLSVNRLDQTRVLILLELIRQTGTVESWLQTDHANFNCFDPDGANQSVEDVRTNFLKYWHNTRIRNSDYDQSVSELLAYLPILNHESSIEQIHLSAYINLVVESYHNDTVIALSEKTFRALVTPAPWTLFGSFGTVARLQTLGFDVLDDLLDHSYNRLSTKTARYGTTKIQSYISSSIENYQNLLKKDLQTVKLRCKQAAVHNQQLLAHMRLCWPKDFANWLPDVVSEIAGK